MTQLDRDQLKQEAQLALTQGAQIALTAETILAMVEDYDTLLDENHELVEEARRLADDLSNMQDVLEQGGEA